MLFTLCFRWYGVFFDHDYRVIQEYGPIERRVRCIRCKDDWVMNDDLEIMVGWDEDFERMYLGLGYSVEIFWRA